MGKNASPRCAFLCGHVEMSLLRKSLTTNLSRQKVFHQSVNVLNLDSTLKPHTLARKMVSPSVCVCVRSNVFWLNCYSDNTTVTLTNLSHGLIPSLPTRVSWENVQFHSICQKNDLHPDMQTNEMLLSVSGRRYNKFISFVFDSTGSDISHTQSRFVNKLRPESFPVVLLFVTFMFGSRFFLCNIFIFTTAASRQNI